MDEKREHYRIKFGFRIENPDGPSEWMAEDISVGGLFVKGFESLPAGSRLRLVFQLPGSSKYIEAEGEVKHHRREGMGIEFVELAEEEKSDITDFIEKYKKYDLH